MNPIQAATPLHWLLLVVTATLFASSFAVTHEVVKAVPPVTLAATRAAIGAAALLIFVHAMGHRMPRPGRAWRPLLLLGAVGGLLPYICIAWGQTSIASGVGGILFGTIPLFTVLCAPLVLHDERFTLARLGGVAVGLAGVVLVVGPEALEGIGDELLGQALTLLGAGAYAFAAVLSRRVPQFHPMVLTAGQMSCAALYLVPLSLALDAPWTLDVRLDHLGGIAWIGIVATAVPTLLLLTMVRVVGATVASLMAFFMPVAALALGIVFLGEAPGWEAYAGLGLILAGAAAVDGRLPLLRRKAGPAEG